MAPLPENELIARCLSGDAQAWDELFDRHYAPATRFVFQMSAEFTREDAEEICQETFLSVIKNLPSFQRNCQFQTWLFRIAANKARDYREKQSAAKRGGGLTALSLHAEDPETGLAIDPPSPLPSPDTLLASQENMLLVREALDHLGDPCREVIELRYFAELDYEEISAALNTNTKTASSRLSKCLVRLEVILRKLFKGEKTPVSPV